MPTKDKNEEQAARQPTTEESKASESKASESKASASKAETAAAPEPEVRATGANATDMTPEAPERKEREEGGDLLSVDLGFPVGPVTLAPVGRFTDEQQAAQHIGWVRPVAAAEPMPDVTGWKAWEWVATSSARDNFDRVLIRPGHVFATERDVYDAETCRKEYTFAGGAVADGHYIPTNYIDRRKRALTLRVYDVTVPESAAFLVPAK